MPYSKFALDECLVSKQTYTKMRLRPNLRSGQEISPGRVDPLALGGRLMCGAENLPSAFAASQR